MILKDFSNLNDSVMILRPIMIPSESVQNQILLQATMCGESLLKTMLQIVLNSVPVPSSRLISINTWTLWK